MRPFDYKEEPLTCLWCGKRHKEDYLTVVVGLGSQSELARLAREAQLRPGILLDFRGDSRVVREVVPFVYGAKYNDGDAPKRDRKARPGEKVAFYKVYFDPPVWEEGGPWRSPEGPVFDTMKCAAAFGLRMAELGKRLVTTEKE